MRAILLATVLAACITLGLARDAEVEAQAVYQCPMRPQDPAAAASRVIGGDEADIANWPGFVALRIADPSNARNSYFCGGVLIDQNWVVTAAHCVVWQSGARRFAGDARGGFIQTWGTARNWKLQVVENHADITSINAASVIGVDNIIVHPNYRNVEGGYDIALLHLARPARGATMRMSTAADADPSPRNGSSLWVAGLGLTDVDAGLREAITLDSRMSTAGSATLREVALPIYDSARCQDRMTHYGAVLVDGVPMIQPGTRVRDSQICAGQTSLHQSRRGPQDSCKGDSGGPLARTGSDGCPVLVGLVSYGPGCGLPDAPGVYTRISTYAPWMREHGVTINGVNNANDTAPIGEIEEAIAALRGSGVGVAGVEVRLDPPGSVRLNEFRRVEIRSQNLSGYIIAMDIDADGKLTYLMPNPFTDEIPQIRAGETITLPPPNGTYRFRAQPPVGAGRVIVLISPDRSLAERLRLQQRALLAGGGQGRGFVAEANTAAEMMNITDEAGRAANAEGGQGRWAMGEARYTIEQ